ncbi:Chromosome segregation protein Spo0J, contains ParB-like nuclease domain [Capnocytophaga haemolytica]|uniref:ParB/Sulfiredoxin domain-containing protein n=1 Tax=Capnocytophaga haemolytica TaxID=45243 RepID=A0AAX2GXR2_9FLAO|nr:ParB/RepB/Spo0J family partition protein [Capnocytophaga haemolytica]AMD85117.1 hypothetical protein AXF12_06040 [Capnocytophaga haemolytica]SFN67639.1 Chromosome segregation protein Spo0J, contains ParB-like nuclease domain [Capnocytophaga haemolytica]SNV04882.1 Uncharacterised protein [Capnocytophaga haemolytica]
MKELKQSETQTIQRSQIHLNPYNPKKHTDKKIKEQLANFKKVGFNGGIKWNKTSGNLIDGHRRLMAMDLYYKYDGTPATDYQVKVEVVEFDPKTEKEQMTYEALGNTRADYALVAAYIDEIDYKNIGLSDEDLSAISALIATDVPPVVETIDDFITPTPAENARAARTSEEPSYEDKKEKVKAMKQQIREQAIERGRNEEAYLTLSFTSHQAKSDFCELLGIDPDSRFAKGEDVLSIIE